MVFHLLFCLLNCSESAIPVLCILLDLHLARIGNPRQLALVLNQMPGVVDNGLFIDICDTVVIGHADGRAEVRDIDTGSVTNDRLDFVEAENVFSDME